MQRASADVGVIFIAYTLRRLITILGKDKLVEYLRALSTLFLALWVNRVVERTHIHQKSAHREITSIFRKIGGFFRDVGVMQQCKLGF